jgi:hypothetical protein
VKHVVLYESWMREEVIVLTSRQGRTITIKMTHGKIEEIDNESGVRFPFVTGQPFTIFMKNWACRNGFKWNGENACDPGEDKIFGVKKKFIPKGHEWRQIFPGKFRD